MAKDTAKPAADFMTLWMEMSIAAPQVVAHRILRMTLAGAQPSKRDQKEFQLMSDEKISAFWESYQAMTIQAIQFNQQLVFSMMSMYWMPWTANKSMQDLPCQLNKAANDMMEEGIKPLHRRAVANAKRLQRVK